MKQRISSAVITLWVNRCIALVLLILLPTLPKLLELYCRVRTLSTEERVAIVIAFYCCAAVTALALWNMDALLRNILRGEVFVTGNVSRIRVLQYCCGCVSLICLPAAMFYYPLVFIVVIMAFLCLAVSVVSQVMRAAVEIREENDLTI